MGIIQTQTIKGTIYSYLGVGIGFVITALLFPRILSTEEIGVLKLLVSFSIIFAQFASLGFLQVINNLFPYFREKESGHNGFLFIALGVSIVGFILSIIGLEFLKPLLIRNNIENSRLFVEYINYLIPLILFTVFFNLFDSYIKALYDAVIGTVLKELIQRILILAVIIMFYFDLFNFDLFVLFYVIALSLPTVILIIILFLQGEFKIQLPKKHIFIQFKKEIFDLCLYGILIGFGSVAIVQVDSILVNKFLGLSLTGIYATNFFFAAIILIPSRPLIKISTTILAEAWKRKDLKEIQLIYVKSSINQSVIGVLLFIGLWINIENIYFIIPREYEIGKWVIFYVGLSNVFEMFTGINSIIIQTSPNYKINAGITFIFLILIVVLNWVFIPILGITGAGIASLVSVMVTNLVRYVYLKFKFGLSPFHPKILIVFFAGIFTYFLCYIIPPFSSFILDILIRSLVGGLLFILTIIVFKVSDEINSIFYSILEFFGIQNIKH
jgi:O-antigen/teichoic acid export membrane protein